MSLLITIISSSAIATVVSLLGTHIINYYSKKADFKHEYFKLVIKKRLEAYEQLEFLIAALKTSALADEDQKPYHICFFSSENYSDYTAHLRLANSHNLWLNGIVSDSLSDLTSIFNQINFEFDTLDESELITARKKYYIRIADLRTDLENHVRTDLLTLHDFSDISNKKAKNEYKFITCPNARLKNVKYKKSPGNRSGFLFVRLLFTPLLLPSLAQALSPPSISVDTV